MLHAANEFAVWDYGPRDVSLDVVGGLCDTVGRWWMAVLSAGV